MKESKAQRLKKLADYKDISIRSIEKIIGSANGIISAAIKRNGDITEDLSKLFDKYPDINQEWLYTGKGEMLLNQGNLVNEQEVTYNKITYKSFDQKNAFYIPVEAMTGFLNSLTNNSMIKDLTVINLPPEYKAVNFIFQVEGDSMFSTFSNGDHVGCRYISNKTYIRYGEPYIVDIGDGGLFIRRIFQSEKSNNHVILRSDNPGYGDIEVEKTHISHLFLITTKLSKNVGTPAYEKQLHSMNKILSDINSKLFNA